MGKWAECAWYIVSHYLCYQAVEPEVMQIRNTVAAFTALSRTVDSRKLTTLQRYRHVSADVVYRISHKRDSLKEG